MRIYSPRVYVSDTMPVDAPHSREWIVKRAFRWLTVCQCAVGVTALRFYQPTPGAS